MRTSLSKRDRDYLGSYCCNCGRTEDVQYHHIVPLALGGNDVISNMCCLCGDCHSKLHYERTRTNISAATKAGLARAKARGVQLGNKVGTHFTTKKSIKAKGIILANSKDFYGNAPDNIVIDSCGISRNSYYKYKRELKDEVDSGIDVKSKYINDETSINETSINETSRYMHHHLVAYIDI